MKCFLYYNTMEEWKNVLGYEGLYQASNYGRIKRLNSPDKRGHILQERILRNVDNGKGYKTVVLHKDKATRFYVHILVYEAFNGPIPEGMQVNHIDEDKSNNRLENLNLLNRVQNNNWGTKNERMLQNRKGKNAAKKVEQYSLDGKCVSVYKSVREAARHTGFNNANISACCCGRLKTYKNFIWKHI